MITLSLRRHAPTAGNLRKAYLGRTDEPLCPEGEAMARRLPPDTGTQTVYVTPLRRTAQTAALLYPAAEQIIVPGLAEMDFGSFEGKNWQDLEHDPQYRAWVNSGCRAPCPGGEGMDGFIRRCTEAFSPLLEQHINSGAPLCAVLHGGTLMALLSRLALPQQDYWAWGAGFCGGYRLRPSGNAQRPLVLVAPLPGPPDSPPL